MRSVKFYCLRKEHWEKMTVEGFGVAVFVVFVLLLRGGGGEDLLICIQFERTPWVLWLNSLLSQSISTCT